METLGGVFYFKNIYNKDMALDATINFGKVTVSTGYDDLATSIVLNSGDGARLPDPATAGAFNLVWWNWTDYPDPSDDPNREIVRCTARSTDTLTVTRGQEGIAASTKNTGGKTYKMILALTAYQMGLIIAQGGNAFGAAITIGSTDANVVYFQYNSATRIELNASGINIYSPRIIYTSGGDLWLGLTDANVFKFYTNNTERMRIEANGHLSVGTAPASASTLPRLRVVRNDGAGAGTYFSNQIASFWGNDAGIAVVSIGVANTNPYIVFFHSTGTASSPTATSGGNFMGGIQIYGHTGSGYSFGGYVQFAASSGVAWSVSNKGTELWIQLTPVNTTTAGTKFVIKGDGSISCTNNATVVAEGSGAQFNSLSSRDVMTNVGAINTYGIAVANTLSNNGGGAGIALTDTSAYTTNITVGLIAYRVGSNAQGRLLIYTKQSTTGGAAPVLAFIVDEVGKVKISATNGAASARLHIEEPTLGNEVQRLTSIATNDDPTESVFQNRVATTDATVTTIHTVPTVSDTTKMIEVRVVARRTGGTGGTAGDGAAYIKVATFKNIAGTVTQIGANSDVHIAEDQAGWDVTFSVSTTNVLVQVTGAADNNVTWHATIRTYELST